MYALRSYRFMKKNVKPTKRPTKKIKQMTAAETFLINLIDPRY